MSIWSLSRLMPLVTADQRSELVAGQPRASPSCRVPDRRISEYPKVPRLAVGMDQRFVCVKSSGGRSRAPAQWA